MTARSDPRRRAERYLRWYPAAWRRRYGEEFTELLVDDITERPRSWRRSADITVNGVVARLERAGLIEDPIGPLDQARRSLASFGAAASIFLVFGLTMWSQINIGWSWSEPDTPVTSVAMALMTAGVAALVVAAAVAAVPVVWELACGGRLGRRDSWANGGVARPVLLSLGGVAVLVFGAHQLQNGWPGTGGHPWAFQRVVPGGVAAFVWALTMSITAYWAHPTALGSFPPGELLWMAGSPVAMLAAVAGGVATVRRLDLRPAVVRIEVAVARGAAVALAGFLVGAAIWVLDGTPGPAGLFHTGIIDRVGLAAMTVAMVVASRSASMAVRSRAVSR